MARSKSHEAGSGAFLQVSQVQEFLKALTGRLPQLFVLLSIGFGCAYAFLMPPFQVPDEGAHANRAFQMTGGHCIASSDVVIPVSLIKMEQRFPSQLIDPLGHRARLKVHPLGQPSEHLNPAKSVHVTNVAGNINSCVPYIPAAIAFTIASGFDMSALALMYAGRIVNLLIYTALVYFALGLFPAFDLPLFVIALLPMSIHQAASLSSDSVTLAVGFLFVAYVLKLSFDRAITKLTAGQMAKFAGLAILTVLCKFNIALVVCLFLIPTSRFANGKTRALVLASTLFGCFAVAGAWQWVNRSNIEIFQQTRLDLGVDAQANFEVLRGQPLLFGETLVRTVKDHAPSYLYQFIGTVGWLHVPPPLWLVLLCAATLVLTASSLTIPGPTLSQRLVLGVACAVGVVSLYVLMWEIGITSEYMQLVRDHKGFIDGLQGRYFLPISIPFLLMVSNGKLSSQKSYIALAVLTVVIVASVVTLRNVGSTYYGSDAPTSAPTGMAEVGLFRQGQWIIGADPDNREVVQFGGLSVDVPVAGRWVVGQSFVPAVYRGGLWVIQMDDAANPKVFPFGGPSDVPVVGDWNHSGTAKAGIYRKGYWILDNGNEHLDDGKDAAFSFGGLAVDIPVVGDWNGDGSTKVGVYREGLWMLDVDGNRKFEKGKDLLFPFGLVGDVPIVGDWNKDGKADVGVYRNGLWTPDRDGNRKLEPQVDSSFQFGGPGYIPILMRQ